MVIDAILLEKTVFPTQSSFGHINFPDLKTLQTGSSSSASDETKSLLSSLFTYSAHRQAAILNANSARRFSSNFPFFSPARARAEATRNNVYESAWVRGSIFSKPVRMHKY